jgi:glucosylceramidase
MRKAFNLFTLLCIAPAFCLAAMQDTASVFITAKNNADRLSRRQAMVFTILKQPSELEANIIIDPTKQFQSITGIGGAITDATAETFAKMPKSTQAELLRAYYDKNTGIGYTLARTNINSCDFSSDNYSYVKDDDAELKSFSIKHDLKYKVPFIKQAIGAAGGALTLYASPWSPPAWMKSNNNMLQGGKLLPAYNQAWANYYVKFINAYQQRQIPVWGLTVQNEPMASQTWESCTYTAEEERDFIKNFLGPTLAKAGMGDKKLIGWDHNRDLIFQRASALLNDPGAAKYIWGIGYHWYETWTGSDMLFGNLRQVYEAYPGKNLIFTEGCIEKFDSSRLNDWALGERYGYSIINDLNSGTAAWTDWNMLLDQHGGPNHAANFCFAPVHFNTQTGEVTYTNAFYYIGHFSKFIRPGAKRIACTSNRSQLAATAFANTDGSIVIVVMNNTGKDMPYSLCNNGKAAKIHSPEHSIITMIIK